MKTIKLTQYIRPHGYREPVTTDVSDEAGAKYDELTRLGLILTAEVVPGPMVHVCISDENAGDDFDQILHANGKGLQEEVEAMLLRFTEEKYRQWLEDLDEEEA